MIFSSFDCLGHLGGLRFCEIFLDSIALSLYFFSADAEKTLRQVRSKKKTLKRDRSRRKNCERPFWKWKRPGKWKGREETGAAEGTGDDRGAGRRKEVESEREAN